jgi:cullin-4
MASVFTLLSLPQTSKGFTALRTTAVANGGDDGSASISRKVPRLDTDSDSATASRSKASQTQNKASTGPIKIEVIGNKNERQPPEDKQTRQLHQCIRIVLTKEHPEIIQTTYEAIYNTCRSIVTVSGKGEGLYSTLKLELEKCTSQLSKILRQLDAKGIDWIGQFVDICEWFNTQTNLLKSLLTYLDQVYIVQTPHASRIRCV